MAVDVLFRAAGPHKRARGPKHGVISNDKYLLTRLLIRSCTILPQKNGGRYARVPILIRVCTGRNPTFVQRNPTAGYAFDVNP